MTIPVPHGALPSAGADAAKAVARILCAYRYSGLDEKAIQDAIEAVLREVGLPYEREYNLSRADKPDFLVDGRIAIEVKVKGARNAVLRQIQRYATHTQVEAVILASTQIALIAELPETLHHTPIRGLVLPVRGAW